MSLKLYLYKYTYVYEYYNILQFLLDVYMQ